jgi:hypothetical protein
MIDSIGVAMLAYGIAGIIGTFIAYGALRKPLYKLQEQLSLLAEVLNESGNLVKESGEGVGRLGSVLQKLAEGAAQIAASIHETAKWLAGAAASIKSVEPKLATVKIPMLKFTFDMVKIPIIDKEIKFITSVEVTEIQPLQPAGEIFRVAGQQVESAGKLVDQTAGQAGKVKDHTLEAKASVEAAAERLKNFAGKLEEAGENVMEISKNKALALVSKLILGYFFFIHLAFALVGLALLKL